MVARGTEGGGGKMWAGGRDRFFWLGAQPCAEKRGCSEKLGRTRTIFFLWAEWNGVDGFQAE